MQELACSHCGQINHARAQDCERCGQNLLWSPVGGFSRWKRVLGYASLGILLGLVGARTQPAPTPPTSTPRLDVVFAIDTTGSMADEIEVVKSKVTGMMEEIQAGTPRPEVRVGLVAYRDHGDAYVTRAYPLTSAVEAIQSTVQQLQAGGGGDTPEAVEEALHCAVEEMNWDLDPKASRLLFLIGDAGGHANSNYRNAIKAAGQKGIVIHTWGCSGLQDHGQGDFEMIAQASGGEFQFLTYQQEVQRQDGRRVRLLYQGKQAYEVAPEVDWSQGANEVKSRSLVDSSLVEAPRASGSAVYKSSEYRPVTQKLENNLDSVLVRQVRDEARKKGVQYK